MRESSFLSKIVSTEYNRRLNEYLVFATSTVPLNFYLIRGNWDVFHRCDFFFLDTRMPRAFDRYEMFVIILT